MFRMNLDEEMKTLYSRGVPTSCKMKDTLQAIEKKGMKHGVFLTLKNYMASIFDEKTVQTTPIWKQVMSEIDAIPITRCSIPNPKPKS